MNITFLGTSAGSPTSERNLTAIVLDLMQQRRSLWLFDCGEATQLQMRKANISLSKLEMIFITHLHGDHLFGLPGVLTSRSLMQNQSAITLVGPKGIKTFVNTVLELSDSWLSYPLNIIELEHNCRVFNDDDFFVEAKLLDHRVPCFGYRIVEKDEIASLNIEKFKQDNIEVGQHFSALKRGDTVTLEDGRIVDGTNYIGGIKKGKKVAILGDTIPCRASVELASDVDVIIHEATQELALAEKARNRGHSTTIEAAEIARQANAKKLIITHISPRYQLKDSARLVSECQSIFANTEIATDFASFKV